MTLETTSRKPATIDRKLELFLTRDRVQQRVRELGTEIAHDFSGQTLLLVGVLKGAAIFLADLTRAIPLDCNFDFISVSSYGAATRSSGEVRIGRELYEPIANRAVLLIEDILDTGITLSAVQNHLLAQHPAVLKSVALLDKPSRRRLKIEADYVGFTIPDRFVVGYGMDFAERYRNLPDIYFVPEDIQQE